jgi:hypothetical protein
MGGAHDLKLLQNIQSRLYGGFNQQVWYHCNTVPVFNVLKAVYVLNLIPLS